jgi:hypothetical protein
MIVVAVVLVVAGWLAIASSDGIPPGDGRRRVRARLLHAPAAPRWPRPTGSCTSPSASSRRRRSRARRAARARSSASSRPSRTPATSSCGSSRGPARSIDLRGDRRGARGRSSAAVPRCASSSCRSSPTSSTTSPARASPVEIKSVRPDLAQLERTARSSAKIEKVDGLEDLFNGVSEPSAELSMTIDAAEANRVGLTPDQVSAK